MRFRPAPDTSDASKVDIFSDDLMATPKPKPKSSNGNIVVDTPWVPGTFRGGSVSNDIFDGPNLFDEEIKQQKRPWRIGDISNRQNPRGDRKK